MKTQRVAALIYGIVSLGIILFQLALAAGAPWGAYAMGGAFPGQFPPSLRIAAIVQAGLLAGFAWIVLTHVGLIFLNKARVPHWLIWVVVVFSAISLVLNTITPSAGERTLWAPVALVMLICSFIVAVRKTTRENI